MSEPQEELPPPLDKATLKSALKAFRKRMKLTRLDDESQINSRNPLTGGQRSAIGMIIPPNEYPQKVWEELARQGKLRHSGKGFYELTDG